MPSLLAFKTPAHRTEWASLRAIWRVADHDLPVFGAGWAFDHLYPWRADPAEACLEGWTLLSALAAADLRAAGAEHLVFVLEPPLDLRQLERAARAAELLG